MKSKCTFPKNNMLDFIEERIIASTKLSTKISIFYSLLYDSHCDIKKLARDTSKLVLFNCFPRTCLSCPAISLNIVLGGTKIETFSPFNIRTTTPASLSWIVSMLWFEK